LVPETPPGDVHGSKVLHSRQWTSVACCTLRCPLCMVTHGKRAGGNQLCHTAAGTETCGTFTYPSLASEAQLAAGPQLAAQPAGAGLRASAVPCPQRSSPTAAVLPASQPAGQLPVQTARHPPSPSQRQQWHVQPGPSRQPPRSQRSPAAQAPDLHVSAPFGPHGQQGHPAHQPAAGNSLPLRRISSQGNPAPAPSHSAAAQQRYLSQQQQQQQRPCCQQPAAEVTVPMGSGRTSRQRRRSLSQGDAPLSLAPVSAPQMLSPGGTAALQPVVPAGGELAPQLNSFPHEAHAAAVQPPEQRRRQGGSPPPASTHPPEALLQPRQHGQQPTAGPAATLLNTQGAQRQSAAAASAPPVATRPLDSQRYEGSCARGLYQ
jgi:hypothetical protein